MAPHNTPFLCLATLLAGVRDSLPKEIHLDAAGKSDLGHQRWDRRWDTWKNSARNLGQILADAVTPPHVLLFWLDDFMADHGMHGSWMHSMDGHCLLHSLSDSDKDMFCDVMWLLLFTTVVWLRKMSLEGHQLVRIVCACNAGKHRSLFCMRLLNLLLEALLAVLGFSGEGTDGPVVKGFWQASDRVRQEIDLSQESDMNCRLAKDYMRQAPEVLRQLKRYFLSSQAPESFCNLDVCDALFWQLGREKTPDPNTYVIDPVLVLNTVQFSARGHSLRQWLEQSSQSDYVACLALLDKINIKRHWRLLVRYVMSNALPQQCSVCARRFTFAIRKDELFSSLFPKWTPGVSLLTAWSASDPLASDASSSASLLTADDAAAKAKVQQKAMPRPKESGASLLTAGTASAGVAIASSSSVKGMPRRPAWADEADETEFAGPAPAKKNKNSKKSCFCRRLCRNSDHF